jgi:hypothetical protein
MAITATVAQGAHHYYSYNYISQPCVSEMECTVSFQSSCEYDLGDNDQYDWNKLVGMSGSSVSWSYRSARWGWRWDLANEKVEIAPYVHDESGSAILPPPEQRIQLDLNTTITLKVKVDVANQKYVFTYDNGGSPIIHEVSVSHSLSGYYGANSVVDLFFFGGNETAPHEMKIDYDNFVYTYWPKKYYITGEATGGITVTGLYQNGSPYSQYLAMNDTVLTPCIKAGSLSTTDVTISEHSICN